MQEYYPPPSFHFRVDFGFLGSDSGQDMRFQEVSGIEQTIGVVPYDEAGESRFTHKLPGKATFPNLNLKRGLLTDSRLIKWFDNALRLMFFETTDITVTLLNENHEPLAAWEFVRAWPVSWKTDAFNAEGNNLAVEHIELAYQYSRRVK